MFEHMFSPEALAARDRQEALNQYRATQIYQQARKDNPTMLEPNNVVDFSNPESTARMQQPMMYQQPPFYQPMVPPMMGQPTVVNQFGNMNPYSNPNLVNQNQWMNPSMYAAPTYGGTWYGGAPYGGVNAMDDDLDSFMLPTPGSKWDFKVRVVRGNMEVKPATTEQPKKKGTYVDRLIESMKNAKITISRGSKVQKKEEKTDQAPIFATATQRKINYQVYKPPVHKHEPGTPYTIDELIPERTYIKVIKETPLNWTDQDDVELEAICKEVAVYDKALAHCGWNIPTFKGCTREDYEYFVLYLRSVVQDYKSKELMNPKIDYRAPYRNRPLPPRTMNENGVMIPDMSLQKPTVYKRIGLSGKPDYEYDRGRDLTQEEWDIFVDRAYWEMMDGAKRIMGRDMMQLNLDKAEDTSKKDDNQSYNPYDPLGAKVHAMKKEQEEYMNNMNFFKYALRHKMNEEQFNSWWFGNPTSSIGNGNMNQAEYQQALSRQMWVEQMTERNIAKLERFVPYDPIQEREWANQMMYNAIQEFTKGSVTRNMSLQDFLGNLNYLNARISEMNVDKQFREAQQQYMYASSRATYQQALQNFADYGPCNPNSPGWNGTVDPRSPQQGPVMDLDALLRTKQYQQFENHCKNSTGHVQLSAIYR